MSARGLSDYAEMASALSSLPEVLLRLREELEETRWTSRLFDTAASVANLEKAARLMWEVRASGRREMHLIVSDAPRAV